MFEFNKRCEYCANHYRHPDAGCGSCVNGNNYSNPNNQQDTKHDLNQPMQSDG